MTTSFISSEEDSDEALTMRTKRENIEIMMGSQTDEIIEELLKCLSQRYQEGLEESMRGIEFAFGSLDALYYDLNNISLNRGGSNIDSREWLRIKKTTINPKNNHNKCFLKRSKTIQKEYQNLSLLLISIIRKKKTFHYIQRTGKSLNQIINQLLLIF